MKSDLLDELVHNLQKVLDGNILTSMLDITSIIHTKIKVAMRTCLIIQDKEDMGTRMSMAMYRHHLLSCLPLDGPSISNLLRTRMEMRQRAVYSTLLLFVLVLHQEEL